jgi:hypothetical protein
VRLRAGIKAVSPVPMRNVLIGYAIASAEAYCANLPFDEFISLSKSLYEQVNTPRVFHGLKRIWEFLDDRGLQTDTDTHKDLNINKIEDMTCLPQKGPGIKLA